ncbi:MAG: hypothetical protein U0X76_10545 [Bacteroidia bacterium]
MLTISRNYNTIITKNGEIKWQSGVVQAGYLEKEIRRVIEYLIINFYAGLI